MSAGEIFDTFIGDFKVPLLFAFISLASAVTGTVLLVKTTRQSDPVVIYEATGSGVLSAMSTITIDVGGAVAKPGVYELPGGSRIQDAILAAGGLSDDADGALLERSVNRAEKIKDGGKIFIPKLGEKPKTISNSVQNISAFTAAAGQPVAVSVNSASQSELEALNGIGPKTAEKIIANRPYLSLEELVGKKVLSQSLYDKLKEQLGL